MACQGVSYAEAWTTFKTVACPLGRPLLWSPLGTSSALFSSASLCSIPPEDTSIVDEKIRVGLIGAKVHRGWGPSAQLKGMDAEGIDVAVIYPSQGLFALMVPDLEPRLAAATARAYNSPLQLGRHSQALVGEHPGGGGRVVSGGVGETLTASSGGACRPERRCPAADGTPC